MPRHEPGANLAGAPFGGCGIAIGDDDEKVGPIDVDQLLARLDLADAADLGLGAIKFCSIIDEPLLAEFPQQRAAQ